VRSLQPRYELHAGRRHGAERSGGSVGARGYRRCRLGRRRPGLLGGPFDASAGMLLWGKAAPWRAGERCTDGPAPSLWIELPAVLFDPVSGPLVHQGHHPRARHGRPKLTERVWHLRRRSRQSIDDPQAGHEKACRRGVFDVVGHAAVVARHQLRGGADRNLPALPAQPGGDVGAWL